MSFVQPACERAQHEPNRRAEVRLTAPMAMSRQPPAPRYMTSRPARCRRIRFSAQRSLWWGGTRRGTKHGEC
jgi:hypothetical protein